MDNIFDLVEQKGEKPPLAERMRPNSIREFVGQTLLYYLVSYARQVVVFLLFALLNQKYYPW